MIEQIDRVDESEEIMVNRVEALADQVASGIPQSVNSFQDEYLNEQALQAYLQTTILGFVTGIRSMSSLAVLGLTNGKNSAVVPSLLRWIPFVAAIGESVADKFPIIPSRTQPLPFLGRLVIGGISGFILCRREQVPPIPGVMSGVLGAVTDALTSHYGRRALTRITKIPDAAWGFVEDTLVSGLGALVIRKSR